MAEDGRNREKIVPIDLLRARRSRREETDPLATPPIDSVSESRELPIGPPSFGPLHADERAELLRNMRAELAELPDVRADKVIEAKLRISSGHYDRDEWKLDLAKLLFRAMKNPPAPEAAESTHASPHEPGV